MENIKYVCLGFILILATAIMLATNHTEVHVQHILRNEDKINSSDFHVIHTEIKIIDQATTSFEVSVPKYSNGFSFQLISSNENNSPLNQIFLKDSRLEAENQVLVFAIPETINSQDTVVLNIGYEDMPHNPNYYSRSEVLNSEVLNKEQVDIQQDEISYEKKYYFIVASSNDIEGLEELKIWKEQKGYNVIVITMPEILNNSNYRIDGIQIRDSAEALKNYLQDQFNKYGSFYLLLVGDAFSDVPIRKFMNVNTVDELKENDYTDQYIPSDAYFSSISTNFNLIQSRNKFYVDRRLYASYQRLPIGRLLISSPEGLGNYMKKLQIYESYPGLGDGEYLNHGLISKQQPFQNYVTIFNGFNTVDTLVYHDNLGKTFSDAYPKGNVIIDGLSKTGIAHLIGHGGPYSLAVSGGYQNSPAWHYIKPNISFTNIDIKINDSTELDNSLDLLDYKYPGIVYSTSCVTCPFDSYNDGVRAYDKGTNMGKSYTTDGHFGGVAWFGATRPWTSGITSGLYFGLGIHNNKSIGSCCNSTGSNILRGYENNLIGDPELRIWKCEPKIPLTDFAFVNSCMNIKSNSLPGGSLCIYNGSTIDKRVVPDSYPQVYSIPLNTILYSDSDSALDNDYLVSIWHPDYLPIQKLFSNGKILIGDSRKYIVKECSLNRDSRWPCYYIVNEGGLLNITALSEITSDNGLCIKSGGTVYLSSDSKITLRNDIVEDGGTLILTAPIVSLEEGFTCNKGGKVIINGNLVY